MAVYLIRFLQFVNLIFIARALLSWFKIGPNSPVFPVVDVIERITEPVLKPIRSVMPKTGMFDFSIIVVIVGINYVLIPILRNVLL